MLLLTLSTVLLVFPCILENLIIESTLVYVNMHETLNSLTSTSIENVFSNKQFGMGQGSFKFIDFRNLGDLLRWNSNNSFFPSIIPILIIQKVIF